MIDRRVQWCVAQGVTAPFGGSQFIHQIREALQVVGLVDDDKLLILQPE